jgi:hypothetical protein
MTLSIIHSRTPIVPKVHQLHRASASAHEYLRGTRRHATQSGIVVWFVGGPNAPLADGTSFQTKKKQMLKPIV